MIDKTLPSNKGKVNVYILLQSWIMNSESIMLKTLYTEVVSINYSKQCSWVRFICLVGLVMACESRTYRSLIIQSFCSNHKRPGPGHRGETFPGRLFLLWITLKNEKIVNCLKKIKFHDLIIARRHLRCMEWLIATTSVSLARVATFMGI